MRAPLLALLFVAVPFTARAQRARGGVADPGVIATGQRITPAGVTTVVGGKVGGVRFGATADEIWIGAPNYLYRIAWRDQRTLSRGLIDGRPGVFSVAIDRVGKHVFASSVGRVPAPPGT